MENITDFTKNEVLGTHMENPACVYTKLTTLIILENFIGNQY